MVPTVTKSGLVEDCGYVTVSGRLDFPFCFLVPMNLSVVNKSVHSELDEDLC